MMRFSFKLVKYVTTVVLGMAILVSLLKGESLTSKVMLGILGTMWGADFVRGQVREYMKGEGE